MRNPPPLQIDMTPDGRFHGPVRPSWGPRIIVVAVLVAVVAGGLAVAALALWFALALIPVAIVAVVVAVAMLRFQLWRASWRARRSFSRERNLRP